MTVKFFATYRDITSEKSLEMPAPATVWALVDALCRRYGDAMRKKLCSADGTGIGEDAIILVNGRHIQHIAGKDTPLSQEDVVSVFPVVAGG